ncbi:MAG: AMMECR1 domain-containing protein [Spirochaetes bacterium]|nr:AMMECR1 domain-containing protein [Spirochaetota bacterium]
MGTMRIGGIVLLIGIALAVVSPGMPARADDTGELECWAEFSRSPGAGKVAAWLHCVMAARLGRSSRCAQPGVLPPFSGELGIFVTIMRGRSVRGCYGAFHHSARDFTAAASDYLRNAMVNDPRHEPVGRGEESVLRVVVTVAGRPFPVEDLESVDLARFGVVISMDDGTSAVFVPAELVTAASIYRAVKRESIVQCHAFRAVTIR